MKIQSCHPSILIDLLHLELPDDRTNRIKTILSIPRLVSGFILLIMVQTCSPRQQLLHHALLQQAGLFSPLFQRADFGVHVAQRSDNCTLLR